MSYLFPFLNVLTLLASVQGFILGAVLYFNRNKRLADRLLAVVLTLFSLASLNIYLSEANMPWQVGVALSLIPTIVLMPIGPLIYFYVSCLLDPGFSLRRKHKLQFIPVMIDFLPIVAGWILMTGHLFHYFSQDYLLEWGDIIGQYNSYSDIPRWMSLSFYLIVTQRKLSASALNNNQTPKPTAANLFQWLKFFVGAFLLFQLIWLMFLIPYIIPATRFALLDQAGYYPIYIPLAVLIYTLGIKGLLYSRLHGDSFREGSIKLSEEQSIKMVAALTNAMEHHKLYLNPDLDLSTLVTFIGSDQRTVSHVLNQRLHKTFNAFVNHYRVEEVKRLMLDPKNRHLTLSGMALECGFNSQSTFQRVFKQSTALSPKAYYQQQAGVQSE
jgi:AraC-like DNA-binding protein